MSLTNNEIKFLKSLQQKKFRDEAKLFVAEGPKLVAELMGQKRFQIEQLYAVSSWIETNGSGFNCTEISAKDLERISGFRKPNEVFATVKYPETHELSTSDDFVLLLDGINDPGNLGTILRTADWFGVSQIIASEDSVELFNPKVVQSSMGSVFRVNYERQDLQVAVNGLSNGGFKIYLAEMDGAELSTVKTEGKIAVVLGSESHGIRSIEGESITIPSSGQSESLNVGIACGIMLYALTKP